MTSHTPESLYDLTKSPEGLEQMRAIAAWFDNWVITADGRCFNKTSLLDDDSCVCDKTPDYPSSLDEIFAAEGRLGVHKHGALRAVWNLQLEDLFCFLGLPRPGATDVAFLAPPLRLIPFILTAQWKQKYP